MTAKDSVPDNADSRPNDDHHTYITFEISVDRAAQKYPFLAGGIEEEYLVCAGFFVGEFRMHFIKSFHTLKLTKTILWHDDVFMLVLDTDMSTVHKDFHGLNTRLDFMQIRSFSLSEDEPRFG